MINHHGVRTLSQVLVFLLLGICAAALLLLPGCGSPPARSVVVTSAA